MRDKYKAVKKIIDDAMRAVCGNCRDASCTPSRLRDGTRVWRIVGSDVLQKQDDGKIYLCRAAGMTPIDEITAADLELTYNEQRERGMRPGGGYWRDWEWHILNLGPEKVEAHLTAVLKQAGFVAEVSVGARHTNAHATSIAVYLFSDADAREQMRDTGLADPSVAAIAIIMGALLPLNARARRHVLDYVMARLSDQEAA